MNKEEYSSVREEILALTGKLHDNNVSITTGKNKISCDDGLLRISDKLGIDNKLFPHYFYLIGEHKDNTNYMSAEDLRDIQHALETHKNYI